MVAAIRNYTLSYTPPLTDTMYIFVYRTRHVCSYGFVRRTNIPNQEVPPLVGVGVVSWGGSELSVVDVTTR